jgi:hypothetical protein
VSDRTEGSRKDARRRASSLTMHRLRNIATVLVLCTVGWLVASGPAAAEPAGANALKFSGRLRHRKLKPGRYRVTATLADGVAHRKRFTVVAAKRPHHRRRRAR